MTPLGYECEYADFDACVADQKAKGHDEESARNICGKIQAETEEDCAGGQTLTLGPWDVSRAQAPRLMDYFGLWAIQEEPFRAAVARVGAMDLRLHVRESGDSHAQEPGAHYPMESGVAVIPLSGVLMKSVPSMEDGTSTVYLRRQIRLAAADKAVDAILLHIDSPGGTVSGTSDLADEVRAAAQRKPVRAFIEDLGASAAYWIATQASQITANRTAQVGSIGTYGVIEDYSGRAARLGIKVHVLRAGEYKGAGVQGTEITPAQLAEWQRRVDAFNRFFVDAVQEARAFSDAEIATLADGRVRIGAEALEAGLVDQIGTFDSTLQELQSLSRRRGRFSTMTKQSNQTATDPTQAGAAALETAAPLKPRAADYAELKAACPGADSDFLCAQLEGKATVEQAQTAWMQEQSRRIEAKEAQIEEAKKGAAGPGVDPLGEKTGRGDQGSDEDPVAEFGRRVAERMKAGLDRRAAVTAVARQDPALHRDYLLATNKGTKTKALIEERYSLL